MEEVFWAWRAYDLEFEPGRKVPSLNEFNAAIDKYKRDNNSHMSRCLFRFYHRAEYAKWRVANRGGKR